jgi:hypothetical protein
MFYRQCSLERKGTKTTSWIPEEFAKVGRVLRLKDEDGWVVTSVGDRLDGEIANRRSVEHRKVPVDRKT